MPGSKGSNMTSSTAKGGFFKRRSEKEEKEIKESFRSESKDSDFDGSGSLNQISGSLTKQPVVSSTSEQFDPLGLGPKIHLESQFANINLLMPGGTKQKQLNTKPKEEKKLSSLADLPASVANKKNAGNFENEVWNDADWNFDDMDK